MPDPSPVGVLARAAVLGSGRGQGHMGFAPSPSDPSTLLLRLADVAAALWFSHASPCRGSDRLVIRA